jgi:predicted DsbA family dithiol-disulfide isomerase
MDQPALKIDFVSDVACPWCAIGLLSLEQALQRVAGEMTVELHFQPFELNPAMAAEGEDATEHLMRKYRVSAEQLAATRAQLRQRGAELGFAFGERSRVWNTFDAHRLLHWAGLEAGPQAQRALKHALLQAYHGDNLNPGDHEVLLSAAGDVGLDVERASEVLASGEFADEVRESERFFQQAGIHAVPAVIVNQRHLIQGGQPAEVFERALREIAAA